MVALRPPIRSCTNVCHFAATTAGSVKSEEDVGSPKAFPRCRVESSYCSVGMRVLASQLGEVLRNRLQAMAEGQVPAACHAEERRQNAGGGVRHRRGQSARLRDYRRESELLHPRFKENPSPAAILGRPACGTRSLHRPARQTVGMLLPGFGGFAGLGP